LTASFRLRSVPLSGSIAAALIVAFAGLAGADQKPASALARSNENAQVLIAVLARFSPEGAGQFGVSGLDEQIFDLKPGLAERSVQATEEAVNVLKGRLASEKDPVVRQAREEATRVLRYSRLMELRADAERIAGSGFDRAKYHDFILAQGLLPPALLRKAVMEEFLARRKAS